MNPTHAETIRRETLLLLEAEEDTARWEAYETFLDGIASDIMAKADVTPLFARFGIYDAAIAIGEEIIVKGIYRKV